MKIVKVKNDPLVVLEKISDEHVLVHVAGNSMSPFVFTETGASGQTVEECAREFIKFIGE